LTQEDLLTDLIIYQKNNLHIFRKLDDYIRGCSGSIRVYKCMIGHGELGESNR